MEFLLASGNAHKATELNILFNNSMIDIISAQQSIDVIEDGDTYEENAFKKAKEYYEKYNRPVVSDDSGLNVFSLPDDLGIYSARFGGEGLSDTQRVELLLEKMKGVTDRSAYFSCVLCFYIGPDEVYFFEGRLSGEISHKMSGTDGFGYDPVFIPSGHEGDSTIAMIPEWKKDNSHRYKACRFAIKFFEEKSSKFT
jgi:XTP/dITP diphosphohydrolase